jgi:Tfp pilus assembly protein PilO
MEVAMKTEERQKLLIIVVVTVVGLWVADFLVIEPTLKLWSSRATEIASLRTKVKNGKSLIARETGIRNHWNQMRANSLPVKSSEAEQKLVSAFDQWSRDSQVEISDIMPQWKNDSDDYKTLNCRVEVSGSLASLSRFMYDVEQGPMAVKVDSFELSAKDAGGDLLTLGMQVSGLSLINTNSITK